MGLKRMHDGLLHYDPSGLLGSPSPVNMAVGGRTTGKTFAFNYQGIKNFIKNGSKFAVLTRYETQLDFLMQHSYLDPVFREGYFDGWQTKTEGTKFYVKRVGRDNKWQECGDGLALTKFEDYKRIPFPETTMLLFDEFIKEFAIPPYLRDEPRLLMNVWSSITRRSERCRVYMMANNVALSNPYFSEWGVTLPPPGKTRTVKHGRGTSITIENVYSDEFVHEVSSDIVSRFTAGTAYAKMADFNVHETNVVYCRKPSSARFRWEFVIGKHSFGVWYAPNGTWFISSKVIAGSHARFVLANKDMQPDTYIIKRSHGVVKMLERAVRAGTIRYEDGPAQYNFESLFPLLGIAL